MCLTGTGHRQDEGETRATLWFVPCPDGLDRAFGKPQDRLHGNLAPVPPLARERELSPR